MGQLGRNLGRFTGQFVAAQILGGRDRQEDDFAIAHFHEGADERLVLAVADGMGGHAGAAEVARIAVRSFCNAMKTRQGSLAARLRPALEYANSEIALAGARDPKIKGAACTLVAAAIEDGTMSWISVGDSSVYLFHNRTLRRLNRISPESTEALSGRSAAGSISKLVSGLTGKDLHRVSSAPQPLGIAASDAILVASDGLDCLGDRQVERILRRTAKLSVKAVAERLLSSVQSRPSIAQDNTTIIFCRVPAFAPVPESGFRWLKRPGRWKLTMTMAALIALAVLAVEALLR